MKLSKKFKLNIEKQINTICHTNERKKKNRAVTSTDGEKAFDAIPHPFTTKTSERAKRSGERGRLTKSCPMRRWDAACPPTTRNRPESLFPPLPVDAALQALSSATKRKRKALSRVRLSVTPRATVHALSRPEDWSGQPFPSPADLPNPGTEPRSHTLQADSLPAEPGKPNGTGVGRLSLLQQVFLTQESNRRPLHCRRTLYRRRHQGTRNKKKQKSQSLPKKQRNCLYLQTT